MKFEIRCPRDLGWQLADRISGPCPCNPRPPWTWRFCFAESLGLTRRTSMQLVRPANELPSRRRNLSLRSSMDLSMSCFSALVELSWLKQYFEEKLCQVGCHLGGCVGKLFPLTVWQWLVFTFLDALIVYRGWWRWHWESPKTSRLWKRFADRALFAAFDAVTTERLLVLSSHWSNWAPWIWFSIWDTMSLVPFRSPMKKRRSTQFWCLGPRFLTDFCLASAWM